MSEASTSHADQPRFKVASHVVSRLIQGRALVLDASRDEIQQLNEVGSYLWEQLMQGPQSEQSLVRAVTERFEVREPEAASDVGAFTAELLQRGLITQLDQPSEA